MKDTTPQPIYLKDYEVPQFLISDVDLCFDLHDTKTKVLSSLTVKRNPESNSQSAPLILNGEELVLKSIKLNNTPLEVEEYELVEETLIIHQLPESFILEIENEINPMANKALDGLYKSGSIFCTQCEPEGFRRITYYLDRPDVMAKFKTKIIADKALYPVLLSNGNPIGKGDLEDGKHWVQWEDPFLKPAYLYALVAGDLGLIEDTFTTMSGRTIDLQIYCDKGNEKKCDHALESLKKSMKWDEDTFGLEYDLDIYMIVAVDSFNMGAMENKGLNIFNSVYVLADEKSATDDNFLGIESVVGHEYFHNWTGNRITCRDWFQLTLKEGLTVYRDQEFSSDLNSRTVQRIQDVDGLRNVQFVEDAGPTSHPIKPKSYIEMNNFYTATVYEKGSEVIRMVRTFLGVDGFRKGMDKYFELYDGQAVTTEDFLHAMSVANNNFDLQQFKNWYDQAGSPNVQVNWKYDSKNKKFELSIDQSCAPTPDQEHKKPFHFPLSVGLVDSNGNDITLKLQNVENQKLLTKGILSITKESETFVFENIEDLPIVSINRGFSAPVKIHAPYHLKDYYFLMANDNDEFNRYEAAQKAATRIIQMIIKTGENNVDPDYIKSFGALLRDKSIDPALKSMLISLPSEAILHQSQNPINFEKTHEARGFLKRTLAQEHLELLNEIYHENKTPGDYQLDTLSIGKRALKNHILNYLKSIGGKNEIELIYKQFQTATNMTEEISALINLRGIDCSESHKASSEFFEKWKKETLVMQKWLAVETGSSLDASFERLISLQSNEVYDNNVPNLVRSLFGSFCHNSVQFHHSSGRGYKVVAEKIIEIDSINPQMASRLAGTFKDFKRLDKQHKDLMKMELEKIIKAPKLSKNVFEIINKILH